MRHTLSLLAALVLTFTISVAAQQDKSKRPSPPASAECKFADGKSVKVDYSSPRMKGRKIYGGLVTYGTWWRTGANDATSLVTSAAVAVEGTALPAGSYTLFTMPAAADWQLIVNKQTGQWGTEYDAKQDLFRTGMQKSALPSPVENFTISFDQTSATSCRMNLDWETTRVSANITEQK